MIEESEKLTVTANPFFDDVIVFLDNLPSSQDKLKPIDAERRIFEMYEKNNVTEFKKLLRERLEAKRKPNWPYQSDLFMAITVSGNKKDVYDKDLDNLLKTLFDTLKGIVFTDDKQIIKLSAEKEITSLYKGVMVAFKQLSKTENIKLFPSIYTTGEDIWEKEREIKKQLGKHTYIDAY